MMSIRHLQLTLSERDQILSFNSLGVPYSRRHRTHLPLTYPYSIVPFEIIA